MTTKELGYYLAHISRPENPQLSSASESKVKNMLRPLWISIMRAPGDLSRSVGVLHAHYIQLRDHEP
jgi:hypothetical protein